MATVSEPRTFNHEETQQRVRHPLQQLRKYIRSYVILEGAALTLLAAAVLFWFGLAFDFGLFKVDFEIIGIHGIDWILELNDVDPSGASSLACRVAILAVIGVCLMYLGVTKVLVRWLREFNDQALALVLERRFPKELGDRLITAVELADPKLSQKYGFSQAMIEKTILEAIHTLKKLPVADVFNWRRLYALWCWVGLATLGLFVVSLVVISGLSYVPLIADQPIDPYRYCWKFCHVASIWTERNVMLKNTYWPRRAHLEIDGFQPSKLDPSDMRVAKDDYRPDLQVRAIEWVVADPEGTYGWRPLRWKDLAEHGFVANDKLARVDIPVDFPDWILDTDELEPNLVDALWEGDQRGQKSGDLRKHLAKPEIKDKIAQRGAAALLDRWLDWREWTVDKIYLQIADTKVRDPLRRVTDYDNLDAILQDLAALADDPALERTVRRLVIPASVDVTFRGKEAGRNETIKRQDGNANRFIVSLKDLKESDRFKFRARGENFFTPRRTITLVPSPSPASITIDKEEPAYIYHRLFGPDQMPLQGLKHTTTNYPLSTTGDTNTIEVPLGAKLVIRVNTDRPLRPERSVFVKNPTVMLEGFLGFTGQIEANADQSGFALKMDNLTRRHDFHVEFIDEDNIRGKRRFKILSTIDTEPQVGNLNVFTVQLRKPKFSAGDPKAKPKDPRTLREQAELTGAYLITPVARLPFECSMKDDYGLVKVGYQWRYRKVDFELVATGGTKKPPVLQVDQDTLRYRMGLVGSNLQYLPSNPISWHFGAYHLMLTSDILEEHLRQSQGLIEGYTPSAGFQALLQRRVSDMINPADLKEALTKPRSPRGWDFDFRDDDGFDLMALLPELRNTDPEKGQTHFLLQIAVQATDNNVETGAPYPGPGGAIFKGNTRKNANGYLNFVVVSENELLAQIALEEEMLFEKLQGAKEKVDAGITIILEQQSRTRDPKADMETVFIRMNDIRSALGSAGNTLRDSRQAYQQILREMEVNRVREDRMSKIENTIVSRLENILIDNGSFLDAEAAFTRAYEQVEREVSANKGPDVDAHAQTMPVAHRQMVRLSEDIGRLLDAMTEGLLESKLVAMLVTIEQTRRQRTRYLEELEAKKKAELFDFLIKGSTDKDKDKDKDDKKPQLKKSSLLSAPAPAGLLMLAASEKPVIRQRLPRPSLSASEGPSARGAPARNRAGKANLYKGT